MDRKPQHLMALHEVAKAAGHDSTKLRRRVAHGDIVPDFVTGTDYLFQPSRYAELRAVLHADRPSRNTRRTKSRK